MKRKDPDVIFFSEAVNIQELSQLIPEGFKGEIVCTGLKILEHKNYSENFRICGNMWLEEVEPLMVSITVVGDLIVRNDFPELHNVTVEGDAFFYGNITCFDLTVAGEFYCEGDIDSCAIEVGKRMQIKGGKIDTHENGVLTGIVL